METINVTRSSLPPYEEYCRQIAGLWESRWLTNMGEQHRQFEADLLAYTDADYVKLYANGHLALENLLEAMDFPAGGEVITTPFTFASTTHAIVRCGLNPVMCDIDPVTYTLDVKAVESKITARTVAILPVHVYGTLCDTEGIAALAARYGLKVIYDAAHAFGVTRGGVNSALLGDASMFSFHATKVFHSIEGGAVFYREEALGARLDAGKNFGIRGEQTLCVGGNAKMNEFVAAMGICNLRHLREEIAKRAGAAARYRRNLGGIAGLCLPLEQAGVCSNYAYFPVLFDGFRYTRDEVCARLKEQGILARKYFYPLTSSFDCYRDRAFYGAEKTPVAQFVSEHILTLPLYADLTPQEVDRICACLLP